MTAAKPLARYGAVEGALASGFATAELHHVWGHDPIAASSKLCFGSCGLACCRAAMVNANPTVLTTKYKAKAFRDGKEIGDKVRVEEITPKAKR
jgi:hypothetical protein